MQNSDSSESQSAGAPTYIVEAATAAVVILLGFIVLFGTRELGSGWTSDGPGAGYFPFYIGVILCISGAGILAQALLSKKRDTSTFVDREQFGRVLSVLLPAALYVGLIQLIGLYVASAIYVAVFMVWLGKYSRVRSIALAAVLMAVFYVLFEIWFKVPLYKGAFDPLTLVGL